MFIKKNTFLGGFAILAIQFMSFPIHLEAQVIIGSNNTPRQGVILELVEFKDQEAIGGGRNSNKGLGLPRVKLDTDSTLTPCVETNKTTKADHIGMVLYNTNDTDGLCVGLHVWNGEHWEAISDPPNLEDVSNYDPSTGILTDRDGETYHTNDFGAAGRWMTQNLRTRTYIKCGTRRWLPINGTTDHMNSNFEQQTAFPNKKDLSAKDSTLYMANKHLGLYYNWCAATGRINAKNNEEADKTFRIQGICPKGWHIPNDNEWGVLHNEMITHTSKYSSTPDIGAPSYDFSIIGEQSTHGNAMLSKTPFPGEAYFGTSKASDQGGFEAYCLGYVINGIVSSAAPNFLYADFWSSTNRTDKTAWYHFIRPSTSGVARNQWEKYCLFPVRCKKDD